MPLDVLSAAQIAGYGRYGEPPSARQLERFFHFDNRDRERIGDRRGDHNRLGFAVQLATVRFLGTFLACPAEVASVVSRTVARELEITELGCLATYARREQTHREHADEIQRVYGYRDFSEPTAQAKLVAWLHARAWVTAQRPSVLFDLATARLIGAKVLLPGASVLARLVAAARDGASDRSYATLDRRCHDADTLSRVATVTPAGPIPDRGLSARDPRPVVDRQTPRHAPCLRRRAPPAERHVRPAVRDPEPVRTRARLRGGRRARAADDGHRRRGGRRGG